VSDGIFKADPVRLLRAFRVAGDLGFAVTNHTLARIEKDADLIHQTSPERVRDEWQKILSGKNAAHYLDQMTRTGLLFAVFPEILPMADCEQNVHHAYTVLIHTFKAFSHLESLFNTPERQLDGPFAAAVAGWNNQRKALLKHALLLHDMGKPCTRSVHADGTVHFYRHAAMSADMARAISHRLRFSNPATEDISRVIRMHNRPLNLFLLQKTGKANPAPAVKFFSEAGCLTLDVLLHSIADHMGKRPRSPKAFVNFANCLSNDYFNAFLPLARGPKLLNGHDLITIFHLSPSPLFKKVLDTVELARLAGTIHSREEARATVERLLRKK
jgi:poly(A) polymerase